MTRRNAALANRVFCVHLPAPAPRTCAVSVRGLDFAPSQVPRLLIDPASPAKSAAQEQSAGEVKREAGAIPALPPQR